MGMPNIPKKSGSRGRDLEEQGVSKGEGSSRRSSKEHRQSEWTCRAAAPAPVRLHHRDP